jgi:hypothetical protein
MTVLERVRRGRRTLVAVIVASAALWGAAMAMALMGLTAIAGQVVPLSEPVRSAIAWLSAAAAALIAGIVLWRGRAARSVGQVALWVEEQQPELRYSLVTAVGAEAEALPAPLVEEARRADIEVLVRRAGRRSLLRSGIAAGIAAVVGLLIVPLSAELAGTTGVGSDGRPAGEAPNRLLGLTATVTPPRYSRLPTASLREPQVVEALVGSSVVFGAAGAASGITLATGRDTTAASGDGSRWQGRLMMPREPGVATLRDRGHQRLVVLSPRVDSAPSLTLVQPQQDTVWPVPPHGKLSLEARATDDIGLDYGHFEYLISTGSGEHFQTVTVLGPRVRLGLASTGRLTSAIDLDTMKLEPGTVLSIRAVALDANDVTGPGRGVSETRTLRVAEKPDSVSITPMPPIPIDSAWMSQRLLNLRTDTLVRKRRSLPRATFVARSSEYATAQEAIRQRVLAVIQLLEDDGVGGSFQTETSTLLRQADKEMWEARLNLAIAHPDSALPYMRRALKILDEIRTAYRYYLRGVQRPIVVDVEKARLQANDPADAAAADQRERLRSAAAILSGRIEQAAARYPRERQAALDSLTYVQVSALSTHPAAGRALSDAIVALRGGAVLDSALAPVRRTLAVPARMIEAPVEWSAAGAP